MSSLDLFVELVKRYAVLGYPFVILHLVVFILTIKSWLEIRQETKALERWVPKNERASNSPKQTKTTGVLDDFVEEAKKLGDQGFFVPMTDFSDRVDSIIDGMVAELHDRTNLFLLVGIAGTLFGVFEFALGAYSELASVEGDKVSALGKLLSQSMSKAFPVGFMGLIFTFVAQIVTASPEEKLRKALSEATKKALKERERQIQSQENNVKQAAERIAQAMEPIKDLKNTLTDITTHVIQGFHVQLNDSLKVVQEQFSYIREVTYRIQEVVVPLRETAASMRVLVKDVPSFMEDQRNSLKRFNDSVRANLSQAGQVNSILSQTSQNLERMTQSLETLPPRLLTETQDALHDLRKASMEVWRDMSADFAQGLQKDYGAALESIAAEAAMIAQSAKDVSDGVNQVTRSANSALDSLKNMPNEMRGQIEKAFQNLSAQSLDVWTEKSQQFITGIEETYDSYLNAVKSETQQISGSLKDAAESWNTIAQSADTALKKMEEMPGAVESQIHETFQNMGGNALGVWEKVSEKIGGSITNDYADLTNHIKANTSEIEESLKNAASEIGRQAANAGNHAENILKKSFEYAEEKVTEGLKKINHVVANQYPAISKDFQQFSQHMADMLSQIQMIQKEFAGWLNDANQAQTRVQEIDRDLARTLDQIRQGGASKNGHDVANLLRDNIEQVRQANRLLEQIQLRMPSTDNDMQKELRISLSELQRIRDGIDRLANKERVRDKFKRWLWFRRSPKDETSK